jgi:hypothetical protein
VALCVGAGGQGKLARPSTLLGFPGLTPLKIAAPPLLAAIASWSLCNLAPPEPARWRDAVSQIKQAYRYSQSWSLEHPEKECVEYALLD